MKLAAPALAVILLASAAFAQSDEHLLPQPMVRQLCYAPEITHGAEFDKVRRIEQKLDIARSHEAGARIYVALVDSHVINAWNHNLSGFSVICLPIAMVRFMGEGDGELAFIMAHEAGHAVDGICKTPEGRSRLADKGKAGAVKGLLFGHGDGSSAGEQRNCESRADEIGFSMLTHAGFSPYDAAGSFGRLQMYMGDTSSGVIARLAAIGKDHPMTPDRIRLMRKLMSQQSQEDKKNHDDDDE